MAASLEDLPLRVRRVKIVGNNRTRPYVVEDQLQDAYNATTVRDVYGGLVEGAHRLDGLGLFESVQVSMDEAEDGSSEETDVTVTIKEKNWYLVQTGATTAGTSGNLDASKFSNLRYSLTGALRNAFGHGEMVDMGYNSPIAGQEGHTVSSKLFLPSLLRTPFTGTLEAIMDTVRDQHGRRIPLRGGYVEGLRGFSFPNNCLTQPIPTATLTPAFPFPNDNRRRRPLGSSKRTFFSDRFNLGGPMTLRGFPFYGAGPRAPKEEGGCRGGDSLGGDIRYTGN
ncbi:unnamed protein product, partial [Scytosiphon promiscuus]